MPTLDEHVCMIESESESRAWASPVVLEAEQRLSRSIRWRLQRRYFERAGATAWSSGAVPYYVTNTPLLAHAYASVLLGWLRDVRGGGCAAPVTLVELGAGSGRFAYLLLTALAELLPRTPFADTAIRYVMTDLAASSVERWRANEALRPFVARGVLDFAVFDAEEDRELQLLVSGTTLRRGAGEGPLVGIANYVFDGIRQDAFSFRGGALYEELVSTVAPAPLDAATEPELDELVSSYVSRAAALEYYGAPELDAILRGYAGRLEQATLLFPCAAIDCIARLAELARGPFLLLSADRGRAREAPLVNPQSLGMAVHGSFSFDVNYHAIAAYVTQRQGVALTPSHGSPHLCVTAFLLGEHVSGYAETRLAYEQTLEPGGPDGFFSLRQELLARIGEMALTHALAFLRASGWDPRVLADCLPVLWRHQPEASELETQDVIDAVRRSWTRYYPIGEEQDLASELGMLLHAYGAHREAIGLFQSSARLHGDRATTRWNIGLCRYALGELEEAFAAFAEATRLDPGFIPAGALQPKR